MLLLIVAVFNLQLINKLNVNDETLQSKLLVVEEAEVPEENHRPWASN
jgi:hypothetical protein